MGEYLPVKQLVPEMVGPNGLEFIIILSCEYIIPYISSFEGENLVSHECNQLDFQGSNDGAFPQDTWEPWVAAVADTILLHEPKWEPMDFRLAREPLAKRGASLMQRQKSVSKWNKFLLNCK